MSYSVSGSGVLTVGQWQELQHQAFIFKYLKAGLSVPPDLLTPIRMSLDSTFFNHPTLGYSAPYGKKYDPEPGRCRRTDGKKWRCAKDAYPDSKYCERHMNRTRNRSRKLVESKTTSQSTSTVASSLATASSSGSRNLQNPPLQSYGNQDELYYQSNMSQLQLESTPYGLCTKVYRGHHGQKPEAEKLNFTPESSHSVNATGMNSKISSEWCFPTAQIASYPVSEPRNGTLLQFNNPQGQNFEPAVSVDGAMAAKQQQEHYFFGMELNPALPVKQDHHSQFDGWPKSRHFGSYMGDQKSDTKTTQLSMSIPIGHNSDFGAHSPK